MTIKIHAGYEISYDCPQPTPMILTLSVHPSLRSNLLTPDRMRDHAVRRRPRSIWTGTAIFAT